MKLARADPRIASVQLFVWGNEEGDKQQHRSMPRAFES